MNQALLIFAVFFALFPFRAFAADDTAQAGTPVYACQIVKIYPHDSSAFTQGLFFHDGYLFESTGHYGNSSLRKVDLATGRVLKIRRLPEKYFGEGIAGWNGRLVMLTWRSRKGFIYDIATFAQVGSFRYKTEGWGITYDGSRFIMSDGTSILQFLEPGTFKAMKKIAVRDGDKAVGNLNELEFVKGEIYANVWGTGYIARISPATGKVTGWIDLNGLYAELGDKTGTDVLNGIAYDPEKDRLFVTGKYWPKLFEIRMIGSGGKR